MRLCWTKVTNDAKVFDLRLEIAPKGCVGAEEQLEGKPKRSKPALHQDLARSELSCGSGKLQLDETPLLCPPGLRLEQPLLREVASRKCHLGFHRQIDQR